MQESHIAIPSHPDYVPSLFPVVYKKKDILNTDMLRHDLRLARQAHLQVEERKLEEEKSHAAEAEKRHHDKQEKKQKD